MKLLKYSRKIDKGTRWEARMILRVKDNLIVLTWYGGRYGKKQVQMIFQILSEEPAKGAIKSKMTMETKGVAYRLETCQTWECRGEC